MAEQQAADFQAKLTAMQRKHGGELEGLRKEITKLHLALASFLGVPFMEHLKPKIVLINNAENAGWNNVDGTQFLVNDNSVTKKSTSYRSIRSKRAFSSTASIPIFAISSNNSPNSLFVFNYFEVTIDQTNRWISVGLAPKEYPIDEFVGDLAHSFAINKSGCLFQAGTRKYNFAPDRITRGDTVGCGLMVVQTENLQKPRWIFFTKNGKIWGTPVSLPLDVPSILFPTVSIYEAGDKVTANFGTKPFKYKIPPAEGLLS